MATQSNLFQMDWGQVGDVLVDVILLPFVVERHLALVFKHRTHRPIRPYV